MYTSSLCRGDHHSTGVRSARIVIITILIDDGLRAARLSITLAHSTPVIKSTNETKGGGDFHIRFSGVALAVEEVEFVNGVPDQTSNIVQIYSLRKGSVQGSKVNYQHVVNVHPHIIITSELEHLTTLVLETGMGLETVSVVVSITGVLPSSAVQGEERVVTVVVQVVGLLGQRDGMVDEAHTGGVVEPVSEGLGGLNILPGAHTGVGIDGGTVKRILVNPSTVPVGVARIAFGSHKTFLVIPIVAKRKLEISSGKSISTVSLTTTSVWSTCLHGVRGLVT